MLAIFPYSKIRKYIYSASENRYSPPPLARFVTSPLHWCINNYGFYDKSQRAALKNSLTNFTAFCKITHYGCKRIDQNPHRV